MNWEQVKAILWLRWRLTRNRFARAGAVNAVLSLIMLGALAVGGMVFGVVGVVMGVFVLDKAEPQVLLLVWDGVLFAFLVVWLSGLMVEIQRAESIDLDKLLHLPVTLQQVFVFNYLASHLTPAIVLLVPGMVGLCVGLTFGNAWRMALLLPAVLSFIFMVTAWTYCLRGWLAALMVNKRRRRAIIVWVTIGFVLLSQLPNLVVNSRLFQANHRSGARATRSLGGVGLRDTFVQAHLVLPPGWVGYGAMQLGLRNPWPGLGATAAAGLLGVLGLMRAYRMTIRFYQSAEGGAPAGVASAAKPRLAGILLVERRLPWLPEDTSALALATFRALTRAPELKMALIMPLVMVVLVISSQLRGSRGALPHFATAFIAAGAGVAASFSFVQAMANMFGLDRNGFRALVLLPTRRHHILLAKNLALFPFVGCTGVLLLVATKLFLNLTWLDFIAGLLQVPLAFAAFSMVCNLMSVLVPYRLSQSTLKAKQPKPIVFLAVFISMLVLPPLMAPVLIPPGLQFLFSSQGWLPWLPVNILTTLIMMATVGAIYWAVLPSIGKLLQSRELRILKEVTEEVE